MPEVTDLPTLVGLADDDRFHVVDRSDTTADPEGTSKQISASELIGSSITITVREKIGATIVDPVSGEFDFTVSAGVHSRLYIEGLVRSDRAETEDFIDLLYNGETTETGSHRQNLIGSNNAVNVNEGLDNAQVANCAGSTTPDGGPTPISITIANPATTDPKIAYGLYSIREAAQAVQSGYKFSHSAVTTQVTTIKLRSGNGATLIGSLALYGEREVVINAK